MKINHKAKVKVAKKMMKRAPLKGTSMFHTSGWENRKAGILLKITNRKNKITAKKEAKIK